MSTEFMSDDIVIACADLVGRSGARDFEIGYGNAGYLCDIGDPIETLWFAEGRPATRAEVLASIDSGLPTLQEMCERDDDPADSRRYLDAQVAKAMTLLPAESVEPVR